MPQSATSHADDRMAMRLSDALYSADPDVGGRILA